MEQKNMNMISTGAFQNEMDASNKQTTLAKTFATVWEKKNAKAARAGGVSLMALSLAACGSDSTTTTATTATTTTATTTTTTTVVAGVNYELTSRGDTIAGGAGADTIDGSLVNEGGVANVQTLTLTDVIDGGDGTDTLTASFTAAVTPFSIANVENITLTDADVSTETVNLVNVSGMDTLTLLSNTTAGDIDNIANIVTLNLTNNAVANNVDYAAAAVVGTADAQTINLSSHTAGALTLDAGIESATINSLGSVANVMTLTATGVATVTVTGAAGFSGTFGTAATTINASAATGAVTINQTGAQISNITTGSGADTIDLSSNFVDGTTTASRDTVDGGAGIDRLVLTGNEAGAIATAAEFSTITNIETIVIDDDGHGDNVNMALLGITTLEYDSLIGAATGIIGVSGGEIQYDAADNASNAVTITINGTSTTDSFTIDINGVDAGSGARTYNGIETLNIATSGTSLMNGAHVLTATAATEAVNVSGTGSLTLANMTADAITSTMTSGTLILGTMQQATNVTGGAEAMTVIGSTAGDIISGGAGIDTITSNAGNDTITLGAGSDIYIMTSVTNQELDVVTDFVVGTDTLDINIVLMPDDTTSIAAGALVAAEYIDVAAGAGAATFTGNRAAGVFEFSNSNDLMGAGNAGTFDATTATAAQLEAEVIDQITTDSSTVMTTGSNNDIMMIMYDEAGNAVVIQFREEGTADTTLTAADDYAFTVLQDVAQGTLTFGDLA
jgi:hypothetical protein